MKFIALTLSTVATVLLVLAVMAVSSRAGSHGRVPLPVQASVPLLEDRQIDEQVQLKGALQALLDVRDAPPARLTSQVEELFALQQAQPVAVREVRTPVVEQPPPRVTVVVQAGTEGKAVVDGRLVRVGDVVDGGLTVESIQTDAVTFVRRHGARVRVAVQSGERAATASADAASMPSSRGAVQR